MLSGLSGDGLTTEDVYLMSGRYVRNLQSDDVMNGTIETIFSKICGDKALNLIKAQTYCNKCCEAFLDLS